MGGASEKTRRHDARKRILVTCPNLHWIHKLVVHKLIGLLQDTRYRITLDLPSNKPFENNLHHIVNEFIKGDCDYWLTIDDDNPPERNPLDLVELDLDIVGCPTPIWHYAKTGDRPIYWNAYQYDATNDAYREWPIREGLQQVDAIGTGCVLFARRVFEDPELQAGAFIRKLNLDGTVEKGNDISFCERARERGWKIYTHYDYPAEHLTEVPLNEVSRAYKALS